MKRGTIGHESALILRSIIWVRALVAVFLSIATYHVPISAGATPGSPGSPGLRRNLQKIVGDLVNQASFNIGNSADVAATETTRLVSMMRNVGVQQTLGMQNWEAPDFRVSGVSPGDARHSGPWPVTGFCDKDKTYTITSSEDLVNLTDEAECVFARGVAPKKPPVGLWYGNVLKLLNTNGFNFLVEGMWPGKLGVHSKCQDDETEFYLVLNFVGNDFRFPAYMYVGPLADPVAPMEWDDGKPSLFVDYTVDFAQVCPYDKSQQTNLNLGIINDPYPINQLIDLVRVVGKTDDGGYIMLGKTLLRDVHRFPSVGDTTFAWWFTINYDDWAFGEVPKTLGKLDESFEYHNVGIIDFARRFVSTDDVHFDPFGTFLRYVDIVWRKPFGLPPLSDVVSKLNEDWPMAGFTLSDQMHLSLSGPSNKIPSPVQFSGRIPSTTDMASVKYVQEAEPDAELADKESTSEAAV